MFDTVIRGGRVVDGTGQPEFVGDIGIKDGKIAAVGGKLGSSTRIINADGAIVTPGWVDVHTHYDGQATWDPYLSPSTNHGVTSVVMGNCGVGFAPVRADRRDWLISVMEGVEDIPGAVLSEGIQWSWESFPGYLDALEKRPFALDVGAQIPHAALRAFVMDERAITHDEATPQDIRRMADLVEEGIRAGALGFSTTRTLIHKYAGRKYPPGTFASQDEVVGIAKAMGRAGHGVFQMTSNHHQMESEIPWLRKVAQENGLPVAFALVQTDNTPDTWVRLLDALDDARRDGLPLYGAISGRPAGILMSWQGSTHPFIGHPLWPELASLAWPERLAQLRRPEIKARLTSMRELAPSIENDSRMLYITQSFQKMFALGDIPEYEPAPETSVAAIANSTGRSELDIVYDMLMEQEGEAMVYFPSFNYAYQNLDHLHKLLQHSNTMLSLADGGAHCHYICDVSMPTYMLTHWVRDRSRGDRLPLEYIVRRQSQDTARVYGLNDRGVLAPGMKADINVIDFDALQLKSPYMAFDLPTGGKRLKQEADGYIATMVSGQTIMENGQETGSLPGQLIRGPQHLS